MLILVVALWQLGRMGPAGGAVSAEASTTTTTAPTISTTMTTIAPSTAPPTTPTTTPATSRPPPTTTTTQPQPTTTTLAPLSLEADGLGVVSFGAPPEEVIAAVSERLGGASYDSGWVNARGTFGTCPGSIVRVVQWHSLRLFFSDGPTAFGEEGSHFFYFSQSPVEADVVIDVETAEGIGIAATVEEMEEAYGARLVIESSSPFGATFFLRGPGDGLLSGTLTESIAEGQVTSIAGGFGCGS